MPTTDQPDGGIERRSFLQSVAVLQGGFFGLDEDNDGKILDDIWPGSEPGLGELEEFYVVEDKEEADDIEFDHTPAAIWVVGDDIYLFTEVSD